MRTLFLSTILFFFSFTSFATHYEGGQIYWEPLGNDQYVFYVQLIGHTNHNSQVLPHSVSISTNITGRLNIGCSLFETKRLTQYCNDTNERNLELRTFKSNIITLAAPPPGVRYNFNYEHCCRADTSEINTTGYNSIYLESYMWTNGANKSSGYFNIVSTIRNSASREIHLSPNPGHSGSTMSIGMAGIRTAGGVPVNYRPGFDKDHPTSPLDTLLPNGTFISGLQDSTFHAALAFAGRKFDSINGSNASMVKYIVGFRHINQQHYNVPNYQFMGSTHASIVRPFDGARIAEVERMDTVEFEFVVTDTSSIRSINDSLQAYVSISTPHHSFNLVGRPIVIPAGNATSIADTGSLHIKFHWAVPGDLPIGHYAFNLIIETNRCPANSVVTIPLEFYSNDETIYESHEICLGGTITLNGPYGFPSNAYQWSPTTGLSASNVRSPNASPSSPQTYYCTAYGDTLGVYRVDLYPQIPILSSYVNSSLVATNASSFESNWRLLYYNIPVFYSQNSTIGLPPADGLYRMAVSDTNYCIGIGPNHDVRDSNWIEFHIVDDPVLTSSQGSGFNRFKFRVKFQNIPGNMQVLNHIVVPGLRVHNVTDNGASLLLKVGSSGWNVPITVSSYGYNSSTITFSTPFQIDFSTTYEFNFVFRGYRAIRVTDQWPYSTPEAIISGMDIDGNGSAILPMVFRGSNGLGLAELVRKHQVSPNPASEFIEVSGTVDDEVYELININGKSVHSGNLSGDGRIVTSHLTPGVYILRIIDSTSVENHRIVIQRN
ncbi:MAG: T9SS type A sorting domain-containing protein [Flavobacteriia bacterium]|nr:T9SS type A sorting domain-containing protein [Flavobacteriia bacterium]